MSISKTTLTALRESLSDAIAAVAPVEKTAYPFIRVKRISDVPGAGFRNFFVEFKIPEPVENGIYSDGVEVESEMRVFMNYQNLDSEDDDALIWTDGHELWIRLMQKNDPTIAGLINVTHRGWDPEDDEPGRHWGAHVYTVRFFARGPLL